MKHKTKSEVRHNRDIRYPEVRLLDEQRELIGIMSSKDAFNKANEEGLDLIELSASAKPPVCFLGQLDKFLYEQKKAQKAQQKAQKKTQNKEIQLRPTIAENDLNRKLGAGDKFLADGDRLKVVVMFRGRERSRIKETTERMTQVIANGLENGRIDGSPQITNNRVTYNVVPV